MKDQLHLASQYLAAANMSFLEKKADDSHTNVGFDTNTKRMNTHNLSSTGDQLSLNYKTFSLDWISQGEVTSISLDGKTHKEILQWLQEQSQTHLKKDYAYEFHYELPYAIDDEFRFNLTNPKELEDLSNIRALAEQTVESIVKTNHLDSTVRIWPHHFDTGAYAPLENTSEITVGLGLAVPDSLSNDHYYYISAYKDGKAILPESQTDFKKGKWMSDGFVGAILPVTNLTESEGVQFFQEAIDQFKK